MSDFKGIKTFSLDKVILMKVTSRERPTQLKEVIKKYVDLANNTDKMVWLFSFDSDDESYDIDFCNELMGIINPTSVNSYISHKKSESKIHAINRDVNNFQLKWDILLNISDDQIPEVKGYDDIIRSSMPDDLDYSLWYNDGWQNRINTQEILGKVYYDRFNYIYHPDFKSFFCDNLSTLVAEKLGKSRKFKECIIKHYHPGWDAKLKHKQDNLYKKNDAYWKHDEDLFNKLKNL